MELSIQGTIVSDRSSVKDLSDDELVAVTEAMQKANKIMEIENDVFYNFLTQVDPKAIIGMQQILEKAGRIQVKMEMAQASFSASHSSEALSAARSMGSLTSMNSRFSTLSLSDSGKRINFQTRMELVKREKEALSNNMSLFTKNAKLRRDNLKAELEEISLHMVETKEAREIFEQSIVIGGIDPLTQRIPGEKYLRYMDEWLKSADSIIEKLRLKTCNLRYKKIHLQNQLKQKEELGESLHPVDLDQLKIDHETLIQTLEEKNRDLLDLKKKTGNANLILSKNKSYLQERMKVMNNLQNAISEKQIKAKFLLTEIEAVKSKVDISKDKLKHIQHIIDNYTAPDLIDYIRNKNDVFNLQFNIKIWRRRTSIQTSTLETCIKNMKKITKSRVVLPFWFESSEPEKPADEEHANVDDDDK